VILRFSRAKFQNLWVKLKHIVVWPYKGECGGTDSYGQEIAGELQSFGRQQASKVPTHSLVRCMINLLVRCIECKTSDLLILAPLLRRYGCIGLLAQGNCCGEDLGYIVKLVTR
jgi:hypothetical protein